MNLLLLNDTYFGATLEEAEFNVLRVGPGVRTMILSSTR